MADVNVNFVLGNDEPIRADFQLEPDVTYTAEIVTSTMSGNHPELRGRDLPNQHPMSAITGLEDALGGLSDDITAENNRAIEAEEILDNKIDSEADTRADEITRVEGLISDEETRASGAEATLQTNITDEENRAKGVEQQLTSSIDSNHQAISNHVSDKNNPHEVTKAQVGLGNVENLAPANMPMSTATKTYVDNADNGLQGQITTINTTIGGYGNIVTHNVSEFATASQGALADTALQPNDNISELTNNLHYQTATQVANSIAVETSNRESADNNLQSQIDAIVSSSDVFDIVGTYAELQAYDISTVPVNDIIKVLEDSTHAGAATYYRCIETNNVKSWSYIGSEGASYTKAEADNRFVPQTRTVNNKALSSDITLTATDVGALPSSTVIPTVNDATVTIQKNGSTVSTFTLNQSSNETVNITVPTKTSEITNDSGYITSSSLPTVNNGQLDIQVNGSSVATFTANQSGNTTANIVVPDSATWGNVTGDIADQTDLQDALDEKQDKLTAGTDLEIISAESARLPQGYTEVEYIQSDGDCYIDTGIISNGTDTIEQKFQKTGTLDTTCSWFGSMEGNLILRFSIGSYYKSSVSKSVFMGGYNFTQQLGDMDTNAHVVKFYCIGNTYYDEFDGLLATYQPTKEGSNPTINSWLFARHGADGVNTIYDNEGTRIFYHKQKRFSGTVILDLVPARRNSDDELGFYNLANNTFLTNSGTGTLTAGADVVFPDATVINFTNDSGYITGINSTDVTTALGYTPANPSSLATVATSGDYDDLTNKPTIPTVNNATLTIQKNGVDVQTFTANASSNVTANISVPTDTGDLTNNAGFITGISSGDVTTALGYTPVNPTSLATVATSGLYSDLTGTPTIPTVDQTYDGTSSNAQSGLAVASAISTKQDSATALTTTNTYYDSATSTLYIG